MSSEQLYHAETGDRPGDHVPVSVPPGPPALDLVHRLCSTLAEASIDYCHWKSNNALDRSACADNDLDLLVSRSDQARFSGILHQLGFKLASVPPEKGLPGVLDYYGLDRESGRLVHVHAHFQLVLGQDLTKNYRLPIERAYLESAAPGDLFRVPAPEYEFIVFVIRMVVKHATWDAIVGGQGALNRTERGELQFLLSRIDLDRVHDILTRQLPYIDVQLFDSCVRSLRPDCPVWTRIQAGGRLQRTLQLNARRSSAADTVLKSWRRLFAAIRRRIFRAAPLKRRLASGGAIIAIVGGDGAGKTTAVDGLREWLSKDFDTLNVHLGKPRWSWITILLRAILKMGQLLRLYPPASSFQATIRQKAIVSPGYPYLIREVCRARDRFRAYQKARRFANRGGLVILDRFPLRQIQLMDGPQARRFLRELAVGPRSAQRLSPRPDSRMASVLVDIEENYYRKIPMPELLIVLRVDPEIAVRRKTDEDQLAVRARSKEILRLTWDATRAHLIDANRPKAEVSAALKTILWSNL